MVLSSTILFLDNSVKSFMLLVKERKSLGSVKPMCDLSYHLSPGPSSLMQLCRLRIRKCFGIQQHHKISELNLPEELKRFLLHN